MSTINIDGKEISYHDFEKLVYRDEVEDASDSDSSEKGQCQIDDVQDDLQYKTYISVPM